MSLALDLLEQAQHLSRREPRRPRQASLRRAISAAYYAIFHLMIQDVAAAFVELQEARHEADYNIDRSFTRLESMNLVARAAQAFATWQSLRTDPVARTYLAALLLWKK